MDNLSDKGKKIERKINGFLMGAIIGGAIGSVIGMKLRPKKEGLFRRMVKKALKRQEPKPIEIMFPEEELKKIPHE